MYIMRYLILLCTLCALSSHVLAQQITSQQQVDSRVEAIRQRDLTDPKKAKFWRRGDSYERLVRLRVMHELGMSLSTYEPKGKSEPLFEIVSKDTNVSNNLQNQDETTIAINRKNKKIIIASANDENMYEDGMPIYRTTNGGLKWTKNTRVLPPEGYIPLGDPIITASNNGNFYFTYLAVDLSSSDFTTNIMLAKSANGSAWEFCGSVIPFGEEVDFEDKEMVYVDDSPTSPWFGRIYILWNRFSADSEEPLLTLASSDDQGVTWNITPEIATATSFPVIKIGPKGEVIAGSSPTLFDEDAGDYLPFHTVQLSTDGGATFKEIFKTEYTDLPPNVEGRPSLKGDFGPRIYPFVSFDIDQKTGTIHLITGTWGGKSSQLLYQYSTNMGGSWSAAQIVGIANPASSNKDKDRFFPWVTVDQVTGEVNVLYYTSENDTKNVLTTVMRQQLTPELTEHPRAVAKTAFDPSKVAVGGNGTAFIGDYIGSDAFDSVYAACWTAVKGVGRDGEVFAYVANPLWNPDSTSSGVPTVIHSTKPVISWISPNPSTVNRISVAYFSPGATQMFAELFSVDGKLISRLYAGSAEEGASTLALDVPQASNGSYFLRITSPYGTAERQIVLTR
jgi:hypothetical protein